MGTYVASCRRRRGLCCFRPARHCAGRRHREARRQQVTPAALDFKVKTIAGKEVDLSQYKGKVIVVVNVASECGLTPQYEGLEALYEKYSDKGLTVLGFPCNQFGKQEPGSDADIAQFCETNYKVKFPMFSKVEVNGEKRRSALQAPHEPGRQAEGQGTGRLELREVRHRQERRSRRPLRSQDRARRCRVGEDDRSRVGEVNSTTSRKHAPRALSRGVSFLGSDQLQYRRVVLNPGCSREALVCRGFSSACSRCALSVSWPPMISRQPISLRKRNAWRRCSRWWASGAASASPSEARTRTVGLPKPTGPGPSRMARRPSWVLSKGRYFKSLKLTPGKEEGTFDLSATLSDEDASIIYAGKLDESDRLVLTAAEPRDGLPARISLRFVAGGDRLLMLLEKKSATSDLLTRLAEVGYTRQGSGFGKNVSQRECVVTGGSGIDRSLRSKARPTTSAAPAAATTSTTTPRKSSPSTSPARKPRSRRNRSLATA